MRTIPEVVEDIKDILNNIERAEHCDGETLVDIDELVNEILTISTYKGERYTNADKIRSMTDEELAMNMMCPNESGLGEIVCDKSDNCNCYECLLKWLQSEEE